MNSTWFIRPNATKTIRIERDFIPMAYEEIRTIDIDPIKRWANTVNVGATTPVSTMENCHEQE